MSGNSAAQYRVLDPKALLTGADGDSLENVLIDPLPDGALCWVIAEEAMYRLAKFSLTAPSGTERNGACGPRPVTVRKSLRLRPSPSESRPCEFDFEL